MNVVEAVTDLVQLQWGEAERVGVLPDPLQDSLAPGFGLTTGKPLTQQSHTYKVLGLKVG